MKMRAAALAAAFLLAGAAASAQQTFGPAPGGARRRYELNRSWRYLARNPRAPAALDAYPASA